ncbi:MAG: hypothetical protein JWQ62_1225, partial [Lacunisphaera sp.]|nr:hypothetical protein [Lacunisphaera sp.]
YHPVMKAPQFVRAMDDRFYIVIQASDPKFNPAQTRALLSQAGGQDIAEIEE